MNSLAKYTDKNIYEFFKPEEICFVVKYYYQDLTQADITTDNLEEAKFLAKKYQKVIYISKKKYLKDCFDVDNLFNTLINELDIKGANTKEFLECLITDKQINEFKSLNKKWFNEIVKDKWNSCDIIGELQLVDETNDLSQATFDSKDIFTCVTSQEAERYLGQKGYFSNNFVTDLRWWTKGILKEVREYSHTSETFLMLDGNNSAFTEFGLFLPANKVNLRK